MKTIQFAVLMLITMGMMVGCQKNNYSPAIDPVNSSIETADKLGRDEVTIKPENFVDGINNPYFPLTPGDTFYYHAYSVDNGDTTFEESYVAVTNDIKIIEGVSCEVIHDVVMQNGIVTEDTYDWYAQDERGNVWYFGEDTKKLLPDGTWSTEGSWEYGVDGAVAGIIMPGDPEKYLGVTYRQEWYVGHAQDKAKVLSTNETVITDFGTFTNCVMTEEFTPLDPGVIGMKWYAPGIGQVKSKTTIGGNEHQRLVAPPQ
jgi:hypothetical protein